jgi:FtsZ-binding cell division protein ZapB
MLHRGTRSLQELVGRLPEFEEKLASLSAHCASLEADRSSLLAERQLFINERASWDRERRCLLGEIDALRRVLNVEKATSVGVGVMPPVVRPASAGGATSVGPLSPKSGSGSHSADASPSPRALHYDAPLASSDHRRASTSGSGSLQPSMVPVSAPSEVPLRNEVKREAPDDFGGQQPPFKRVDLRA